MINFVIFLNGCMVEIKIIIQYKNNYANNKFDKIKTKMDFYYKKCNEIGYNYTILFFN